MSTTTTQRLVIDTALCRGHRQCVFVAPDLVRIGDDGWPYPLHAAVPAAQRGAADDAVLFCPEGALSLFTEPDAPSPKV